VLTVGSSGVRVATGDGLVLVRSMSWPGDVPRSAGTWAQEAGLTVGTRFDPVTPERARWARGESSSYRLEVPA
jgi:hypothetical protein